jgi:uncharacterized protein (TIGR02453 family)
MTEFAGFERDAMELLDQLGRLDSAGFKAEKPSYQRLLAIPAKSFVSAVGDELRATLSHGIVDQPKTNGSIAPINNDLRFSPDKAPYKDHLLLKFWEGRDKKTAPTLYIRIAHDGVGFATGAVFADLPRWREAVASTRGAKVSSALDSLTKATGAEIVGQELKRVPAPYPADHPRADLLRHKLLQVRWQEKSPAVLTKPVFVDWCVERLRQCGRVHRWLVDELE